MARSVRIKDHHAEQRLFERRAIAAAVIMLLALGSVIARLVWLQVVQYDYFADLSQGNRIKIEPIPPNRGLILDRNGLPLATNAPSYQLELTREQVTDIDATLIGLAQLGLLDNADIPEPEEGHSRPAQLRGRAGQAAAHRRGAGALRRAPLRVSRRRDPAAPDALLPARRQQRARDRLRRRHQRGRQEDARTSTTTPARRSPARAASSARTRSELHGTRGCPAAARQRAGPQRRAHRQRSGDARAAGADRRQRPVPHDRSCACSRRRRKRCAASAPRRSRSIRRTATSSRSSARRPSIRTCSRAD